MHVQRAHINKTLEASYKTSNFNASLDLGGFLKKIYQYFSFIPIQDWSIFQSWKYLEVGVFMVRCNFRSFLAPHFAVRFSQNHNRTTPYFCGHMCGAVQFIRCGLKLVYFSKFGFFLPILKLIFSFVLGQVLNYWVSFSLFWVGSWLS